MRLMTFMWFFVAAITGGALYLVSQQVQMAELRLKQLNRDIASEEEAIHVLKAEWSYLNTPSRLKKLSSEYLRLGPLDGGQIVALSEIPLRPDDVRVEADAMVAVRGAADDVSGVHGANVSDEGMRPVVAGVVPPLPGRKPGLPSGFVGTLAAAGRGDVDKKAAVASFATGRIFSAQVVQGAGPDAAPARKPDFAPKNPRRLAGAVMQNHPQEQMQQKMQRVSKRRFDMLLADLTGDE